MSKKHALTEEERLAMVEKRKVTEEERLLQSQNLEKELLGDLLDKDEEDDDDDEEDEDDLDKQEPNDTPVSVPDLPPLYLDDDWDTLPIEEALTRLSRVRARISEIADILERRGKERLSSSKCWVYLHFTKKNEDVPTHCRVDIQDGREVYRRNTRNRDTGTIDTTLICSQKCFSVYSHITQGGQVAP